MKKQINPEETKLVVITRADLSSNGQICVQSAHSVADFAATHPQTFKQWKEESNSIICLSCKSEDDLLYLYNKYSKITQVVKFFEPDVDQYTSICLYATSKIRRSLSHLPLSLKNNEKYEKA